eukprot:scaffold3410_cov158-Amphora_coffeaeformis.AAC.12
MPRLFFLIGAGFVVCCTLHQLTTLLHLTNLSVDGGRKLRAYSDTPYVLDGDYKGTRPPFLIPVKHNSNEILKNPPQEVVHGRVVPNFWNPCELKDKNLSDAESVPITYMLSNKTAVFLHPGKSGGGTFKERTAQCWRTLMKTCHPIPCKKKFDSQSKIIVTIRDPIDRFVSAFYWRLLIVCDRKDKRKLSRGATEDPERFCKRPLPGELWVLRNYNKDVNKLAESLCSPIDKVRARAEKSLQKIQHAKVDLQQWLNFSWHPEDLFPVVTESGITSLEIETDESLHWLYNSEKFESEYDFQRRSHYAEKRRVAGDLVHTSSGHKKSLTPEAEQCLLKYFQKDYEILKKMEQTVCKTEGCHQGLQSILKRRNPMSTEAA